MIYMPDHQISRHFTMREVARSETATRLEIDNTPPSHTLENAVSFAVHVLEPVRTHFGIPFSPQSWFRCEALEKVLCRPAFERWAAARSKPTDEATWADYFARKSHPTGGCGDIEIPSIDNDILFGFIRGNLRFDQLIREGRRHGDPRSGWVHVSYRSGNNRHQVMEIAEP